MYGEHDAEGSPEPEESPPLLTIGVVPSDARWTLKSSCEIQSSPPEIDKNSVSVRYDSVSEMHPSPFASNSPNELDTDVVFAPYEEHSSAHEHVVCATVFCACVDSAS